MSFVSSPHQSSIPTDDMIHSPHKPSVPTDGTGEMIAEMTSLGLPTSFIARLEGTTRKSRRKHSSSDNTSCNATCSATTNEHERFTDVNQGAAENSRSAIFRVRSVRLYTPKNVTTVLVEDDVLDRTIEIHQEAPSIDDDAENRPHSKFETSRTRDGADVLRLEESTGADTVEVNDGTRWEPVWDEHYQCYYFCNTQTCESTWDPPPGFEKFTPSSLITDHDNSLGAVNSFVTAQDISSGVVYDKGITDVRGRDSGLKICSTVALAEQVGGEEGPSSPLEQVEISAGYKEVMTVKGTCGGEEGDYAMAVSPRLVLTRDLKEQSSPEDVDYPPAIPNSHIRFRDSEESNSSNEEVGEGGRIDWEEIKVEMSTQLIRGDAGEGFKACSPSSKCRSSYSHAKVIQHIGPSKERIKKRRLRIISGADELDKVLLPGMLEMMSKNVVKYWLQRYTLFARYDKGVKMDEEGWFSVTPEAIAKHQASRCATGLLIDAFTGVGGNAIQFALTSLHVIAIDINPVRIEYARHNAEIYGVADKIEFIVGDFFQLAPFLKADVVFLSPPWGGPEYLNQETYDLQTMLQPKDGYTLFKVAQSIAPNIALFVPRNVDCNQLEELSWLTSPPLPCEVEKNFVNDKLKAMTAYYGEMARQNLLGMSSWRRDVGIYVTAGKHAEALKELAVGREA